MTSVRCCHVEKERMKQHHITRRPRALDDLQRDTVMFFSAVHETRGARACVAVGVEIANVSMPLNQPPIVGAPCACRWRVVSEVLMHQPVRARHDQRSSGPWRDVTE